MNRIAVFPDPCCPSLGCLSLAAQTVYNAMLENNCSESASRMSAMENSTKSAGEMLSKLTLAYNRCVWLSWRVLWGL